MRQVVKLQRHQQGAQLLKLLKTVELVELMMTVELFERLETVELLFHANYVRQPTDALVSRLRARTRRDFFAYGFKATESPVVELTTAGAWRHRVLVYLCVNTNLHNACHSIRFALKNSVWDYARSQCTRTEELRYNFHLSLD